MTKEEAVWNLEQAKAYAAKKNYQFYDCIEGLMKFGLQGPAVKAKIPNVLPWPLYKWLDKATPKQRENMFDRSIAALK